MATKKPKTKVKARGGLSAAQQLMDAALKAPKRWVLMTIDGAIERELPFQQIAPFSEGFAAVRTTHDGPWGYIDRRGELAIEMQFATAGPFSGGRAAVKPAGETKVGYIDTSGRIVIPPRYVVAEPFGNGLAAVARDGQQLTEWFTMGKDWCYVDHEGRVVIDGPFMFAKRFTDQVAVVLTVEHGDHYIDRTGALALRVPKHADHARELGNFRDGVAAVFDHDPHDGAMGPPPETGEVSYIDRAGTQVVAPHPSRFSVQFDLCEMVDDRALFTDRKSQRVGYLSRSGVAIEPVYLGGMRFDGGTAVVTTDAGSQLVDRDGGVVRTFDPAVRILDREAGVLVGLGAPQ